MMIVCPSCNATIAFDGPSCGRNGSIRCSSCSSVFNLVVKAPASAPAEISALARQNLSVMVAHRDSAFCSAVARVLGKEFTVTFCHDGHAAVAAISRIRPDVALIDVELPGMYGFQVCETVRNDDTLSSVRLIIVTALYDTRNYIRSSSSLYGADALIDKHEVASSLQHLVWTVVGRTSIVEGAADLVSGAMMVDDPAFRDDDLAAGKIVAFA